LTLQFTLVKIHSHTEEAEVVVKKDGKKKIEKKEKKKKEKSGKPKNMGVVCDVANSKRQPTRGGWIHYRSDRGAEDHDHDYD